MSNEKISTISIERGDRSVQLSLDKITGCLLGGAIGGALGSPIEFVSISVIKGIGGAQTAITHNSYLRWLITQNEEPPQNRV